MVAKRSSLSPNKIFTTGCDDSESLDIIAALSPSTACRNCPFNEHCATACKEEAKVQLP